MTSMGPSECTGKNCKTVAPGTGVMLMGVTDITVRSTAVHAVGCGWTTPPYMGNGPFTVEGRRVDTMGAFK